MAHLSDHLTAPGRRADVVLDACELIDRQVRSSSGLSGLAIRSAYSLVLGLRPGMIATTVDSLLAPFAEQLDPYYQQHLATGRPLADILVEQRPSMADSLLAITDDRADRTSNRAVRRAYGRVRGSARQHVEAAAPGIAALLTAHVPAAPTSG